MIHLEELLTPEAVLKLGDLRSRTGRDVPRQTSDLDAHCGLDPAWRVSGSRMCFNRAAEEPTLSAAGEPARASAPAIAVTGVPANLTSAAAGSDSFMLAEGFTWDQLPSGACRWRHLHTGVTVLRAYHFTNSQWRDAKIDSVVRAYLVALGIARPTPLNRTKKMPPRERPRRVAYA